MCLHAVERLEYAKADFETIVVDDGSGDPPDEVVRLHGRRLELVYIRRAHAGPAATRNEGARRAQGLYLAFTDSDCRPARGWLQALESAMGGGTGRGVGGPTVNVLGGLCAQTSQELADQFARLQNAGPGGIRFLPTSNLAVPREEFLAIGGFDEAYHFAGGEDREFCLRWRRRGFGLEWCPEAVVEHAHRMDLRGFLMQQFRYGQGARRFRQAGCGGDETRRQRWQLRMALLREGMEAKGASRLGAFALRAGAQVAVAAGYAWGGEG